MSRNRGPLDGGIPDYETPETDANDVADYCIGGGSKKPRARKPKPERTAKRIPAIRVRRTKGKRERRDGSR